MTGQVDPEGKFGLFKGEGLTVADLRQAVIHVRQRLNTSERRTCNTISMARSSQSYKPNLILSIVECIQNPNVAVAVNAKKNGTFSFMRKSTIY